MSIPIPSGAKSVLDRLRAATGEIHQALHLAAPFAAIGMATIDRLHYGALLALLYRYHRGLSGLCGRGAEILGVPDLAMAHRARIAALEKDLEFLGVKTDSFPLPAPGRDGAFAAGCLYTVQGSTLGGKVIYRQLDYLFADEKGRTFFRGSAEDGRQWQMLCAALERKGPSPALEEGALYAFTCFRDVMEEA